MEKTRVIVVGGGIGGLTAAAYLSMEEKCDVTLLEASLEWGGCAGKFSRGAYTFPVGATLGLGFEAGGIHDQILNDLNIEIDCVLLNEVMTVNIGEKKIVYFKERDQFLVEMEKHFPEDIENIRAFFKHCWKMASPIYEMTRHFPVLPPVTPSEWLRLLALARPNQLKLIPSFNQSLQGVLKKYDLDKNKLFVHFIDGLIIDSLQATSKHASFLMAAIALDVYHRGAFYLKGGLYKVADAMVKKVVENGGTVKRGRRVVSVSKKDGRWLVVDQRDREYVGDHVILNTPLESLGELLDPSLYHKLPRKTKVEKGEQWGAFTLYLSVKEEVFPEYFPLFSQVVPDPLKPVTEGHHLFVSVSSDEDRLRAPKGFRTMTVSTHTNLSRWGEQESYDQLKEEMTNFILLQLETVLPNVRKGITQLYPGAPKAWEQFTNRPSGGVGGYPQTVKSSLFYDKSHRSNIKGLWFCGDTVFPGAGTMAVSSSGFHVARSIKTDLKLK
ncbi:phytoene desaturase family protein [Alteribacter aurantiacus]|uniref:phytoene desaturase family protein n=1 Tax=Alteribacter aurantiacus TaxID=254410 RepID=UPI00042A6931|nr:FAD-dependent oxidoreductase [Alteribacter aurantiacus]